MKRIFFTLMTLIVASFFMACEGPAANNATANKPANAANTAVAPAADKAAAEAEIKKLIDTTTAALNKNDADAMEKVYADNYMIVNLDGSVQNKAERLATLRSGDAKYTAFSYSDANIRINTEGNGAVVIAKLSMKGTFKSKPLDGDYRNTLVYSKTKDGWKLVSAASTKIEAAAEPAKADDKKTEAAPVAPANK